jgi:hypothetical protein
VHRSGTSALAGALAAAGAECGQPLLPANDGNPLGYWELAPVVELNDRVLAALQRRWHDITPLPAGWQNVPAVRELEGEAADLLSRQFAQGDFALLKDPRLCLTMPFWRRALLRLGWPLSLIVIARPVGDVIRSLRLREILSARDIAYLWARSMIEALRACFHDRALLMTYEQLLSAPQVVLESIATTLELPLDIAASDRFVDASLRHQNIVVPDDVPAALGRFCAELYAAIAEAAALGVTVGAARFREAEAAIDAVDRLLLPQMLQQAHFEVREEREGLLRETDAARENIAKLVNEIDAARSTIESLAQEIANARQAHRDRDCIEQQLRARLTELGAGLDSDRPESVPATADGTPANR